LWLIGHGIDIVRVSTIGRLLCDPNDDFIEGWFTPSEKASAPLDGPSRADYFAGRQASKEAVVKALGTGLIGEMAWTDIEIVRQPSGAPSVKLSGETLVKSDELGVKIWLISISHSDEYTIASAIAFGD